MHGYSCNLMDLIPFFVDYIDITSSLCRLLVLRLHVGNADGDTKEVIIVDASDGDDDGNADRAIARTSFDASDGDGDGNADGAVTRNSDGDPERVFDSGEEDVGDIDGNADSVGELDGKTENEGFPVGDREGTPVGEGVRYVSATKKVLRISQSVFVIVSFEKRSNMVQLMEPVSPSFRSKSRKSKFCNDSISSLGIIPDSLLLAKLRKRSSINDPISLGMRPVNSLLLKPKYSTDESFPISFGIEPASSLFPK
mmetsp:Transcript_8549/g.18429  ORF Transcript_8549/g.18429 Transcript_8549/m.18429 type:complete len:254 (+) Transcript_8549:409-1170(+)